MMTFVDGGLLSDCPSATLRLQLHEAYTMDDARADLPYFHRLGVSHLYLSPISRSRRGSVHGYDVVDHGRVDAARGGLAALRRLAAEARLAGMGLLLDIVPNHMATDRENAWWWDVLRQGKESARSDWFDIDWEAPWVHGRVLAPFLEKPYADAMRCGDIRLQHDAGSGWCVAAHGATYPLAPESLTELPIEDATLIAHDPGRPDGRRRLHELLERQHYRLAWWRSAAKLINWRRFFEESGLIGVRVEREEVFRAVHALPLQLYAEGIVDGLRIDHVDGLAQPLAYCGRLRAAMEALRSQRPGGTGPQPPWIVVEKILAPEEVLDKRWAASGTTGYDFAADVGALLHDGAGESRLFSGWCRIAADDRPPHEWVTQARRELLSRHFAAERNRLLDVLMRRARSDGGAHVWNRQAIGQELDALLWHFPTYRSYVEEGSRAVTDQFWFDRALEGVWTDTQHVSQHALLSRLERWLGGSAPDSEDAREAVRRFEQLTPPLAAKSLEDTVFYRYGCLLSRNEVGSDPAVFALAVEAFHERNVYRAAMAPRGLLATATHDHKRGEDVRARLAVLSEIPDEWLHASVDWLRADAGDLFEGGADLAFRYMMLQTLVGAWPPGLNAQDSEGVRQYLDRIGEWAVKALREGKQGSSWWEPDLEREAACLAFLDRLAPGGSRYAVLRQIEEFVCRLEPAAIGNSLIQAALRMTCPGIPDLYQGTEFRDFSLVDPDNRRPVDFALRAAALREADLDEPGAGFSTALFEPGGWPAAAWSDGRIKQALTAVLLRLRRSRSEAFAGSYRPLELKPLDGGRARRLLAFSRGDEVVVIAAVKCVSALRAAADGMPCLPADHWEGAMLSWPMPAGTWRDVLRGRKSQAMAGAQRVADLLDGFPLAVLCRDQG